MGRYGFKTALNRAFSSYRARQNAEERNRQIAMQSGKQTKAGPFYKIVDFDFNKKTRVAHIDFSETIKYRKIERYVTRNYIRYPIYSNEWSTKIKIIKKTIKLTNLELEKLDKNEDPLIKDFSLEIVFLLDDAELVPSWVEVLMLKQEKEELIKKEKSELKEAISKNELFVKQSEAKKRDINLDKSICLAVINKNKKKLLRVEKRIANYAERKKNVFLTIITLGIYAYLRSTKYFDKLLSEKNDFDLVIEKYTKEANDYQAQIDQLDEDIKNSEKKLNEKHKSTELKCIELTEKYDREVSQVKPLLTYTSPSSDFIPLKKLVGCEYQKIVGCYVIHNKEKDKYYVGQSKDVYKRVLRDHFNGTEVKNIIFAEDYFSSEYVNKDDLFEVKIIRCTTKDELDSTEKELIEEYDSFRNGYNGTSGNS